MENFSFNAAKWTLFAVWLKRLLGLCSTFVLLKLLTPTDFGIAMTAMLIVYLIDSFAQVGSSKYLIQSSIKCPEEVNTSWTLSVLLRSVASIVLFFISIYYLVIEKKIDLGQALLVISVIPFFSSLINPGFILDEIDDNYKNINLASLYSKFISVIITIICAFIFKSFWALIAGIITDQLMNLFLSYRLNSYKPRFCISMWRKQIGFSTNLYFLSIIGFLRAKIDNFIVLKIAGIAGNGKYTVAQELGNLVLNELVYPLIRGFFSTASKVKDNQEHLSDVFNTHLLLGLIFLCPSIIGIYLLNDLIESVLFSKDWVGIGNILPLVVGTSLFLYINSLFQNLLILKSKFKINYILDFLYVIILVSFIYLGPLLSIESLYHFMVFRLFTVLLLTLSYSTNFSYILKNSIFLIKPLLRIVICTSFMALIIQLIMLSGILNVNYLSLFLIVIIATFGYFITFFVSFVLSKPKNKYSIYLYEIMKKVIRNLKLT